MWLSIIGRTVWLVLVAIFCWLMLRLTLPYLSFESDTDFLASKQKIIHIKTWRYAFYFQYFFTHGRFDPILTLPSEKQEDFSPLDGLPVCNRRLGNGWPQWLYPWYVCKWRAVCKSQLYAAFYPLDIVYSQSCARNQKRTSPCPSGLDDPKLCPYFISHQFAFVCMDLTPSYSTSSCGIVHFNCLVELDRQFASGRSDCSFLSETKYET